jgi:hypothetical protein
MKCHEALTAMMLDPTRRFYNPRWKCDRAQLGAPNGTVQICFVRRSDPTQNKWEEWKPYPSDISATFDELAPEVIIPKKKKVLMAPALRIAHGHYITTDLYASQKTAESPDASRFLGGKFVRWLIDTHAIEVEVDA